MNLEIPPIVFLAIYKISNIHYPTRLPSLYTLPLSTTNTREYLSTSDIDLVKVFSEFADKRKTIVGILHSLGEKNVIYSYT